MTDELTHEQLRELARKIRERLPDGLSYCLLVWPPGEPTDAGYFSNAHRAEAIVAMEALLGVIGEREPPDLLK